MENLSLAPAALGLFGDGGEAGEAAQSGAGAESGGEHLIRRFAPPSPQGEGSGAEARDGEHLIRRFAPPSPQGEGFGAEARTETEAEIRARAETDARRDAALYAAVTRRESRRREADVRALAAARSVRWAREADALAAREPEFDLESLRADPVFTLLLTHGVPLERAWLASTAERRIAAAAERAEKAVADHIRANGARPAESGGGAQTPPRPDAAALSDREVLDVLARLDRNERVSFG